MPDNAYIFVADALRADFLSELVADTGETAKVIASSTITPTSFSSIFSGLHPVQHSVRSFGHELSEEDNWILNGHDLSASFFQRLGERGEMGVYNVLGATSAETNRPLEDLEPPFIHVERANETHAAYSRSDFEVTAGEFWNEYAENGVIRETDSLVEIYRKGVKKQAEYFKEQLRSLERNGLLDDTLVIFTSDHGELLGLRNGIQKSHTLPLCPELSRVPMVILHPDSKELETELVSHVDIAPTIADELGLSRPDETHGINIFEEERQYAYCDLEKPKNITPLGKQGYKSDYSLIYRSLWDRSGGRVICRSDIQDRIRGFLDFGNLSSNMFTTLALLRNCRTMLEAAPPFLKKQMVYSEPQFEFKEADQLIRKIEAQKREYDRTVINESQEEQLKALGYK